MKNIDIRLVLITASILIFVFVISIVAVYLVITRGSNSSSTNNSDFTNSSSEANLSSNKSGIDNINQSNKDSENDGLENIETDSNQENDVTNTPTPTFRPSPTQSNVNDVNDNIKKLETPVLSLNYSDKKFDVTKKEIQSCGESTCYYIELASKTDNYKISIVSSLDQNGNPAPSGYGFCNRSTYEKGIEILRKNYDLTLCKNEQGYINKILINGGAIIPLNQKNRLYIEVSLPEQSKMKSLTGTMFDDISAVLSSIN
ncbi:MAG: hypothetical protein N3A71_02880 [Candidatus Dojkabacteria bacterium]|nr:hypothetical protein [Candidatus Dojkabacteria bacterium]